MTRIKFLAPFKSHKAGAVAEVETNQAEWLISRKYAEPVESLAEATTPPRPVSSKASSATSRGKK